VLSLIDIGWVSITVLDELTGEACILLIIYHPC